MRKRRIWAAVCGIIVLTVAGCGRKTDGVVDVQGQEEDGGTAAQGFGRAYQEWESNRPQMVTIEKPKPVQNGEEGILSYRWGMDCIAAGRTELLLSCDCYFPGQKLQQKLFYVAKGPDFVPGEVFRQDSLRETEGLRGKGADVLEYRKIRPQAVEDGYVYELNGAVYLLSRDFGEARFLCDLGGLMGELYDFSPWVAERNLCDVAWDATRILACTNQGLYEYDLESGEKELLEPAVYAAHEIILQEGDCSCGETGFEFSGPVGAEYIPGEKGYAFLTGTEYGDPNGIVLRSWSGEELYRKETEEYRIGFRWLETQEAVYLAAFYGEEGGVWMDCVDVRDGAKETFAVPEEVFLGTTLCVAFPDPDTLVYLKETKGDTGDGIGIFRLSRTVPEEQKPKAEKEAGPRALAMNMGGYDCVAVWLSSL